MPDKEKAKEELKKLIEKYNKQKSEIANEEQVCQSLILPLFSKILGWDTENPSEFKAQYSKHGKRSDYVVFLNGISQFVIEAKALDREIKQTYQDYEQAINYAKNKEKDFAILTNFKHFIVLRADTEALPLQCEVRAIDIEKAAEKEEDFDIIWNFQKEVWSAEKGDALYRLKPGRKVEPVSKRLVEDMRKWRSALLTNMRKHSRLNDFADFDKERPYIEQEIQRFIDRLIFICYCEDRELKEKELKGALEEKEARYSGKEGFLLNQVKELFKDYRSQYDSDLFFENGYCDRFRFEDYVLIGIITDLRKPSKKLPYNFADIEADVLGKAYENFIGHIITGEKRFGEKESRSKRKEEGVYYTPQYIVNYIVDNTLRAYIKEKGISSFEDLLKIKVLDPACGSGTFLIRAFEVLEEEAWRILGRELGYDEKVKLVTNCIFGVDKDERAVDITKLRLSLALAARQKLPELGKNIQCGDSLIDDVSVAGEKAFKWEERFKGIMQNGGFDVVVGNPPYFNIETMTELEKNFLKKYKCYSGKSDILYYFYTKGIELLKKEGVLGFITSRYFIEATNARSLRAYIVEKCEISKLIDLSHLNVFKDAGIHTAILILKKAETEFVKRKTFYKEISKVEQLDEEKGTLLQSINFSENGWLLGIDETINIFKKIDGRAYARLGDIAIIEQGQKSGLNKAFTVNKNIIIQHKLEKQFIRPLVKNSYISPYFIEDRGLYLIYASDEVNTENAKNIISYLKQFKSELSSRAEISEGLYPWYRLQRPRSKQLFDAEEKLIVPYRAEKNRFGYDDKQRYNDGGDVRIIVLKNKDFDIKYVLGILNSSLMNFYYSFIGRKKGSSFEYFVEPLQKIPIKILPFEKQKNLVKLVDKIISLHNRLNELGDKHGVERERIEEGIKKTDAEIDELVYQLYGITDEEKKIIEESLAK